MESDELASVKALRKAKKKEIQAWMTAFEEREGCSPEARYAYYTAVGRRTAPTRISGVFSDRKSWGYVRYPKTDAWFTYNVSCVEHSGRVGPLVYPGETARGIVQHSSPRGKSYPERGGIFC